MGQPVVHFEINGPDPHASATFYSRLFGWSMLALPGTDYVLCDTQAGDGINGGFTRMEEPTSIFYVEVPDVNAALDHVQELGGFVVKDPYEFAGGVTFARFADPEGNLIGLVGATGEEDSGVSPGTNAPLGWFEVHGFNAKKLWKFYRELFGWTVHASRGTGFHYGEVDTNSPRGINGGIATANTEATVILWAAVGDLPGFLERAVALGAGLLMPPTPVNDRLVVSLFVDPLATTFGVFAATD